MNKLSAKMPESLRRVAGAGRGLALLAIVLLVFVAGLWIGRGGGEGGGGGAGPHAGHAEGVGGAEGGEAQTATLYTCSMHPSVRLPDPEAKCPICFMDLIPVTEDDEPGSERFLGFSTEALRLAQVETSPVRRSYPEGTLRLVGEIAVDETRTSLISAHFPGRIERLFPDYEGVLVRRGDHVAEIYSPELVAAQEELRLALEAVAESEGRSESLQTLAEATLAAAREKLRRWELSEAQVAELEELDQPQERVVVDSPVGGIVTELAVSEGGYVRAGQEIARVADLDHLWVEVEAFLSQLPFLHYGQRVRFTSEAMPGEVFEGRISFIDPVVDERTRTATVRLNVENDERRLRPGMFVRASVTTRFAAEGLVVDESLRGKWISPMHPEVVKNAPGPCDVCGMPLVPAEELGFVTRPTRGEAPLVVPVSAVMETGQRALVYVEHLEEERVRFEGREVVLGPRVGDVYVVREGLEEGERVATEGAFKIDSAMQIAAKPSMMSPPEPADPPRPALDRARALPEEVRDALEPVYRAYFRAQESLAADDFEAYLAAARDLVARVEAVPADALAGEAAGIFRRAAQTLERAGAKPPSIAEARVFFEELSAAMLSLVEHFGHQRGGPFYRVHCPMAFDDRGADWLARRDEVLNPYFGARMLRCGSIEESYPALAEGPRAGEAGP